MLRGWISALLFALALAFQAAAPVAASVAMERAAGLSVDLCLNAGGKLSASEKQWPGPRGSKHDLCSLCDLCCSGVAPLEAGPAPVGSAPVQWTMVVWTAADRALPALRQDQTHRARAPPFSC